MTLLLTVTIKIAILMLGALAATALLHRRSAAVRHWVLTTALAGCVIIPALDLFMPAWTISLPDSWSTSSTSSSLRLVSQPDASPVADAGVTGAVPSSDVDRTQDIVTVLTSIWVAGASVGILILLSGLLRLRKLAADSEPVSEGPWHELSEEVARRYQIRRPVRLLRCHHPTMLATWGIVKPTILLPEGAESWAEDRVHAVLHHELAHVVRGDWLVALTANLLRAVYWFNPLLWIAYRRLRHEGERACDDLVLTSGISGSDYATHLLAVARESAQCRHPWSPAIAIAHRSMLEGRVRAMLNARVNRKPLTMLGRATTVAVLAAVTVSVGVVSLSGKTDVPTPSATDVRLVTSGTLPILSVEPERRPVEPPARHAATLAAQSQPTGGTIEGVLYDQFGGLLPGASVKLTAVGNNSAQDSLTDRGGSFVFKGLAAGDYELVTDLPGFTSVKVVLRAEPGATVRRHITLPIGTLQETIHVTCASSNLTTPRPTAPTGSTTPGLAQRQAETGPRGVEPKIPSTFTGGIGGQIRTPSKLVHANPVCPTGVAPQSTVVRLAGRIGIDGLFTDLHNLTTNVEPAYVASAMEASRKWVFTPTLLNGAPIEVNISVTFSYSWSN